MAVKIIEIVEANDTSRAIRAMDDVRLVMDARDGSAVGVVHVRTVQAIVDILVADFPECMNA